jgi:CP family cyanate transporter-like MFS transporter
VTTSPRRPVGIALLVCAVCLIAANMRTTITGVGPLLTQIAADLGTSTAALGALASVPLLTWAIVSPLTHGLSTRFGMTRVVLWAMIALGAGTAWRSWPGSPVNLWLGTVLIGAALAVANVVMPAIVKRDFGRRVPLMMSVYTALLGGVGALASGVVVPISAAVGGGAAGWRIALAATSALLPLAIALWVWVLAAGRPGRAEPAAGVATAPAATATTDTGTTGTTTRLDAGAASARRHPTGIWRDRTAWLVAAYMGLQSSAFYMLVTWLAPFAASQGRSAVAAGFDVMIFQIVSIIGSLTIALALRGRAKRWVPAAAPAGLIVTALGLIVAPEFLTVWVIFAGLAGGALLSMSLTLIAERARDHAASSALSGMSQSVGYLFAALGPVTFGALHAASGEWTWSLLLLLALAVAELLVGLAVGRERYVFTPR